MALPDRESPKGKPVALFVTCMVDMLYPETGMSTVRVLEHLGVHVDFPATQTCCGQPGFNAGHRKEAARVARQFLKAFKDSQVIVTPSGSCAAMVRHEYPTLFPEGSPEHQEAVRLAGLVWELSEFIVDGLGVDDLKAALPKREAFAFHDACHGLRVLGLGKASRTLVGQIENADVVDLPDHDVCCGFGGLFSVKMADVSGSMLKEKMRCMESCQAGTILTGDVSCMTHMNGGLSKASSSKRVRHVVDVLAAAIPGGDNPASS